MVTSSSCVCPGARDYRYDIRKHALGANPLHKDLFLWIDYLAQFEPTSDALQRVIDAFAASPVENPDKTTGIHLRIDKGKQAIGAAEAPAYENITSISQLATLKNDHLEQGFWIVYHYAFFGKQYASGTSSGFSLDIPSTDFVVTLGAFVTQDAEKWTQIQAGTLMHELGHNLGLHHGALSSSGFDDSLYKPTYFSVMNYNYQMGGVTRDHVNVLDYARVAVGSVNEQNLFERDGFPGLDATTPTSHTTITHVTVSCSRRRRSCSAR